MILHRPFVITSRLMAGVDIGQTEISIQYEGWTDDGRRRYHYFIGDMYEGSDLRSVVGGGTLQQGMASLLAFLGAAAEGYYDGAETDGEGSGFTRAVVEWASQHSNEIDSLRFEIEESQSIFE